MWGAVQEYINQITKSSKTLEENDHCLKFILELSKDIVKQEYTPLVRTSYPNFSKALMKTGLQYLEGGYDNVPCVKAMKVMGRYSKEIRNWIQQALSIDEDEQEIGGLDWGQIHDDL